MKTPEDNEPPEHPPPEKDKKEGSQRSQDPQWEERPQASKQEPNLQKSPKNFSFLYTTAESALGEVPIESADTVTARVKGAQFRCASVTFPYDWPPDRSGWKNDHRHGW